MSKTYDILIGEAEVYAAGSELVIYCPRCRRQLSRLRVSVSVLELLRHARHTNCPSLGDVLSELLEAL